MIDLWFQWFIIALGFSELYYLNLETLKPEANQLKYSTTFKPVIMAPKSFQPLIWSYNFGSWLNILPFYWNKNESRLYLLETQPEMREKKKFWKGFAILNISIRICVIIFILVTMKFGSDVQPEEIILLVFILCIFLMSTPIHVQYFCFGSKFVNQMNTFLQLDQDSGM